MTQALQTRFKAKTKDLLYRTGGLGSMHRRRNRDTLTVLMFHRVIAPGSPAWAGANPLFTMSTGFFDELLRFIRRHYSPVGLEDVARARRGESALPPRALLVTFDDGWADNVEFAAPLLKERMVPAVFFVATGALKSGEAFWQEQLYAAAVMAGPEGDLWRSAAPQNTAGAANFPASIMDMISWLEQQGGNAGRDLLRQFAAASETLIPQMMTPDDVTRLAEDPLFDFGTHGVSHTPFPHLPNPEAELATSWSDLASWCTPPVQSLSFPHGQYTPDILSQAMESGYEVIFDSEKVLSRTDNGIAAPTIGRFELRPPGSDPSNADFGRHEPDDFDAGRIATEMFLRPIRQDVPEEA